MPTELTENRKYTIVTSDVHKWTDEKKLTAEDKELILYLHNHATEKNLTLDSIAAALKKPGTTNPYSSDSVYQAMTGRRSDGSLRNFLSSVRVFRSLTEERKTVLSVPFVTTNLTKKISAICETARLMGTVQLVIGESHSGKTTALQECARQSNPERSLYSGNIVYLRIPAGASRSQCMHILCRQLRIPTTGPIFMMAERIIEYFDDQMCLIVDEAHQLVTGGKNSLVVLEFFREIHDITNCGLVLSATPVWAKEAQRPEIMFIIKQIINRHLIYAKLPDKPTKSNLNDFAKAAGLKPATAEALDLQKHVIETTSLGRWIKILQGASRIAAKENQELTWNHVLTCHSKLMQLAGNS